MPWGGYTLHEEKKEPRNEMKLEIETEEACRPSRHTPGVFLTVKPLILGTL